MKHLRRRRSRGQALVEFALILPFFAMLLFGIIDLARYVFTANTLNEAAREAARTGSVLYRPECTTSSREDCVKAVVRARVAGVAGPVTPDKSATPLPSTPRWGCYEGTTKLSSSLDGCVSGQSLRVRIVNDFTLVTPIVGQFLGNVRITGDAEVTVQS